jgi:hypothetical protein
VLANISVEVDGNTASGHAVWLFYADTAATPTLKAMGTYEYEFRKDAVRGWRVSSRRSIAG